MSSVRVILVHGWSGGPHKEWFPWLANELKSKIQKIIVVTPPMPHTDSPTIEKWVPFLEKVVGKPDKNLFFIGHSIGCQTILRYLERLPKNIKIGGAIFVGGWLTLKNLKTEEEKKVAIPWLNTPLDFVKIKSHLDRCVVFLSDNDYYVPLNNKKLFEENLGAKVIVEYNKGHFSKKGGVTEVPEAVEELIKIIKVSNID